MAFEFRLDESPSRQKHPAVSIDFMGYDSCCPADYLWDYFDPFRPEGNFSTFPFVDRQPLCRIVVNDFHFAQKGGGGATCRLNRPSPGGYSSVSWPRHCCSLPQPSF